MKQPKILKYLFAHVFLPLAIGIVAIVGMALPARAGLTGPYTNDFYTLHLWHLQDTSGTIPGVATNGVYFNDSTINPLVVPLLISNTPGPILVNALGSPTNYSLAGLPGPGIGPVFTAIGTNFGYALSAQTTPPGSAFFAPWDNIGGAVCPDPSYANTNNSSTFANTNTGAFTWEALIQPSMNLLTTFPSGDQDPEILCMDGGGPVLSPYQERAVQFRLKAATPSSGQAQIEWNSISFIGPATNHDFLGLLPSTGPDALTAGTWYHVAWAYTGGTPTNGDPPHVMTLYWTKFDPTRTNADVVTNIAFAFCETNLATHTAFTYPYPSNSIIGTDPFVIGNSARLGAGAMGAGWPGNIAEVRISNYYRHPNEFMFNSSAAGSPPLVNGPATNNFVGYGQTLNLNLQVSGSQPYSYQWYQSGISMGGQTNSTLTMSNITYAANSETFYAIVTNTFGSATSAVATVTVGATLDGFFNTGCGPSDNPLDQTAPGSVDLHWIFTGVNPDNGSSNAIVWSDGSPLSSGGGVGPDNGASVWIWAHENSGRVSGTYSLETTFQVDETVVTNTVISGTVGALGASGGSTMQMFLNGVENDVTLSANPAETVYAFTITNGLQPGTNILVCTAAQTGLGTAGNNAFNLDILSDTGVALTNAPAIINQPGSVTNILGAAVSFSAVALGAPPLNYYWLSNGVAITQPVWVFTAPPSLSFVATNFSISELVGTNFYANYQIVFSNFVGSVTSQVATLDIQIPPLTVASAGVPIWDSTNNETNIVVYFSGAVDPTTATTTANYSLTGGAGASVLSATLGGAPGEVILTTTTLSPTTSYTLTVRNVNSTFGLTMSPSPTLLTVGTYPALALWLKASTGTVSDGSGGVGQWNDLSTNGNNFLSAFGPAFDPVLATNASGYTVVRFNGTNDDTMYANNVASLQLTGNLSIFAVVSFDTLAGGTNGEIISETADNNLPAPYDYYANASAVVLLRGTGSGSPGQVSSSHDPSTGVTHILDVVMQGMQVTHRLDGLPNGTGTMSTLISDAGQTIQIGTREDGANHLTGDMTELILTGQALSTNDVASMEKYLGAEYNLPVGPQVNTNPTNIVFSVVNNQLQLSWPSDHTGWQLQAQTNSTSVGISTNWSNVNNTTGSDSFVVPINLTNGTVFYRLVYP